LPAHSSSPPTSEASAFWPESWPDQPRREAFPWRTLIQWLIPGLICVALSAILFLFLQRQASRPIVYLTPEGQLSVVRTGRSAPKMMGSRAWVLDRAAQAQLHRVLPLLGAPSWSPDGRYLATTVLEKGKIQTALFAADATTPTLISSAASSVVTQAGDGWSPNGTALAMIEHDGIRPLLSFVDIGRSQVVTFGLALDVRAPLQWHPSGQFLLVTSLMRGITPTLLLASGDGSTGEYAPPDDQAMRADGSWSPDGLGVAYVAPDARRGPKATPLAGSIWVADSDGTHSQVIVTDTLNLAPVWAPKGDLIFFTRYVTATNSFDLYRVKPDGSDLAQIGPGSDLMASLPFDRGALLHWSPDGSRLFFIGADRQRRQMIYTAAYDGAEPRPLPRQCQSTDAPYVRWTPTSRALLVACPSGQMALHWLDPNREPIEYPTGQLPAWRP
jgi:Tol biopolymer transport system component